MGPTLESIDGGRRANFGGSMKGLVIRSGRRFNQFIEALQGAGVETHVLDLAELDWLGTDFQSFDIVIFYPQFYFSSNSPLALWQVKDCFRHIVSCCKPDTVFYPDPGLIDFYNDKYKQYLFLSSAGFPIPDTMALTSPHSLDVAVERFGFPLVLKNRYGAGGDTVSIVSSKKQALAQLDASRLNFTNPRAAMLPIKQFFSREFWYYALKLRRMRYPLPSWPLLAQRFCHIKRDLKTVVGDGRVVEAHWRRPANEGMWKMNIDGGAIGEWSFVPPEPISISESLAAALHANWLNTDLLETDQGFLIGEYSPVWHHYAYREKPSFIYADDYNLEISAKDAANLESLITSSLVRSAAARKGEAS
jgi:hypothetical protein